MTIKSDILTRLDGLIDEGTKLVNSYQATVDSMGATYSDIPEQDFRAFTTKATAAIDRIAGEESQFFKHLPELKASKSISSPGYNVTFLPAVVGSIVALRDAVDNGHLESLETRIRAHVHDDFLEQAKDLLDSKYHVAAMVLIGGVLEDHLQKLCTKNGLTWNGHGSISKYNDACHQGTVYDKPTWRRIQSIGDLRNDVAHGQGAGVKVPDVEDAYKFVGRFIADHPA
ncbi:MAG: hypothetical protein IID44_02520 [Planctomycetes bacterium]|nr:hypothetical protein [Planctomycetota bacterium]